MLSLLGYKSLIPSAEDRAAFIESVALLKRNAMAGPFERAFAEQKDLEASGGQGQFMQIHYRDEEAIYIQASPDRVTVIFSTIFKDETDRVYGKVFLQVRTTPTHPTTPPPQTPPLTPTQEFVDARRLPTIQTAPQVLYTNREPPLEIRHLPLPPPSEDIGYVTFVLFPRHFTHPNIAAQTISHIQLFRDYLHYHIKCSKAYMHSRMRFRVAEFQKVLNRAKMEKPEAEKKTVTCVFCFPSYLLVCLNALAMSSDSGLVVFVWMRLLTLCCSGRTMVSR